MGSDMLSQITTWSLDTHNALLICLVVTDIVCYLVVTCSLVWKCYCIAQSFLTFTPWRNPCNNFSKSTEPLYMAY